VTPRATTDSIHLLPVAMTTEADQRHHVGIREPGRLAEVGQFRVLRDSDAGPRASGTSRAGTATNTVSRVTRAGVDSVRAARMTGTPFRRVP
jgi:hypothetical protein